MCRAVQVKEQAPKAAEEVAGTMEQAAQNISEQAVPAARRVGEEVEDGAQRLKKNAGPAADDAVAAARKVRGWHRPAHLCVRKTELLRGMLG